MEPKLNCNVFSWTEDVLQKLHRTFSLDNENELVETVHYMTDSANMELNCIMEEENYNRAQSLHIILRNYVLHLHLRKAFLNKVKESVNYALKFLSCFLDLHFFLSQGNPAYLEHATQDLFLCLNGDNLKMWDVLLHCRLLKKKYSSVCYPVLRRILNMKVSHPLEPRKYLEYLLLLRLWKVFSPQKDEKCIIVNLAGGVILSENFVTYLSSLYSIEKLKIPQNVSRQKLAKIFICKKFPKDFFKKMRAILCCDGDSGTEVTTTSQPYSVEDNLFYIDKKSLIGSIVTTATDSELSFSKSLFKNSAGISCQPDEHGGTSTCNSENLTDVAMQGNKRVLPANSSTKVNKQQPDRSEKKSPIVDEVPGKEVSNAPESDTVLCDLKKKRKRKSENNSPLQISDTPNTSHEHLGSSMCFVGNKEEHDESVKSCKKIKKDDVCNKFNERGDIRTEMVKFRTDPIEINNDEHKVNITISKRHSENNVVGFITCHSDENNATAGRIDANISKVECSSTEASTQNVCERTDICVNRDGKHIRTEIDSSSLNEKIARISDIGACDYSFSSPNTDSKIKIKDVENQKCGTDVENVDAESELQVVEKCIKAYESSDLHICKGDSISSTVANRVINTVKSFGDVQLEKNIKETIKVNENTENVKTDASISLCRVRNDKEGNIDFIQEKKRTFSKFMNNNNVQVEQLNKRTTCLTSHKVEKHENEDNFSEKTEENEKTVHLCNVSISSTVSNDENISHWGVQISGHELEEENKTVQKSNSSKFKTSDMSFLEANEPCEISEIKNQVDINDENENTVHTSSSPGSIMAQDEKHCSENSKYSMSIEEVNTPSSNMDVSHLYDMQTKDDISTVHSDFSNNLKAGNCLNPAFNYSVEIEDKNLDPITPSNKFETVTVERKSFEKTHNGSPPKCHNAALKCSPEAGVNIESNKQLMNNAILESNACKELTDDRDANLIISSVSSRNRNQNGHELQVPFKHDTVSPGMKSKKCESPNMLRPTSPTKPCAVNTSVPYISHSSEIAASHESTSNTKESEDCKGAPKVCSVKTVPPKVQDSPGKLNFPDTSDSETDGRIYLPSRRTSRRNMPSTKRKEIVPSTSLFLKRSNRIKRIFASDNSCPPAGRLKQLKLDFSGITSSPALRSSPRKKKINTSAVTTDVISPQQRKLVFSGVGKEKNVSKNNEGKRETLSISTESRKHTKKETVLLKDKRASLKHASPSKKTPPSSCKGYNLRTRRKEKKPSQ